VQSLTQSSAQLQVGANVTIGGLVPTYYSGSPQLTNFNKQLLWVNTPGASVEPITITYDEFTFERIGTLVEIDDLTITGFNSNNIYVRNDSFQTLVIRIDGQPGLDAETLGLSVGNVVNIVGPLGYYDYNFDSNNLNYVYLNSNFQLMLTDASDILVQ